MAVEQIVVVYKAGDGHHRKHVHISTSHVIILKASKNSNKREF
jgi:hypothetical protein